jgi:anti-anti-sigma regulatory factor
VFFGSFALNDLVRCHDEGASDGVPIALVSTNSMVSRVVQATRLDEILAL